MKNNIAKFNWAAFFGNWSFATGILIFHYRELGFSFFQIFLLSAIYEGLNFLLEIPTGILADLWGYKKTIVLGCLISSLSFFIVLMNPYIYASFVIWSVLSAICTTLNSGTYEAYIYETVQMKDVDAYPKVLGSIRMISFSTQAACIIMGGFLSDWIGFNMALFLSGVGGLIETVILLTMDEIEQNRANGKNWITELKTQVPILLKTSWLQIKNSGNLQQIFFFGALIFLAFQFSTTIFQPFLENAGYKSHISIALFSAGSMFLLAFGAKLIGRFDLKYFSNQQKMMIILTSASLPLFFLFSKISGIIAFGIIFLSFGMGEVLFSSIINQVIPSEVRATMLSFQNQLFSLIYCIAAIGLGAFVEMIGIPLTSCFIALMILLSMWIFSTIKITQLIK